MSRCIANQWYCGWQRRCCSSLEEKHRIKVNNSLPGPAQMQIPQFTGNRESDDGAAWLKKYELIARVSFWTEEYMLLMFPLQLGPSAERWITTCKQKSPRWRTTGKR